MEHWVEVRFTKGPRKDEEVGVRLADYAKRKLVLIEGELMTYEEAGAVIMRNADGSAYEPPERAAKAGKPTDKDKE